MNQDNRIYYENFDWKKASLDLKLREKVENIIKSIPDDVNSLVDIGCGDGSITNNLKGKFKVFATDRSINALKYVKTKKFCSSADLIPLKKNSFDLVFSSEMIEHLPEEIFQNAIGEFKKISRKYIYLTFPNNENIKKNLVKCPVCKNKFNKVYHLRNLNVSKIKKLFPNYDIVFMKKSGKKVRIYNKYLSSLKHKFVNSNSWIPLNWTKNNSRKTMCPKCSTKFIIPYKFSLIGFIIDGINTIISRKVPYQLFVLLKAKNVQ